MIKLYHYSQEDFKGYVKPAFFGLNNYSKNSQRARAIPSVYWRI